MKEFIGTRDKGIDELLDKITEMNKKLDEREDTIDHLRDQIVSLTLESSNKVKEQKEVHERSYE